MKQNIFKKISVYKTFDDGWKGYRDGYGFHWHRNGNLYRCIGYDGTFITKVGQVLTYTKTEFEKLMRQFRVMRKYTAIDGWYSWLHIDEHGKLILESKYVEPITIDKIKNVKKYFQLLEKFRRISWEEEFTLTIDEFFDYGNFNEAIIKRVPNMRIETEIVWTHKRLDEVIDLKNPDDPDENTFKSNISYDKYGNMCSMLFTDELEGMLCEWFFFKRPDEDIVICAGMFDPWFGENVLDMLAEGKDFKTIEREVYLMELMRDFSDHYGHRCYNGNLRSYALSCLENGIFVTNVSEDEICIWDLSFPYEITENGELKVYDIVGTEHVTTFFKFVSDGIDTREAYRMVML